MDNGAVWSVDDVTLQVRLCAGEAKIQGASGGGWLKNVLVYQAAQLNFYYPPSLDGRKMYKVYPEL